MAMGKNLFGEKVIKRKSYIEKIVTKYDQDTYDERVKRTKRLIDILPKGSSLLGELEPVLLFDEAKRTYINGEFIATILLSQAFIEHMLVSYLLSKGYTEESSWGLSRIIEFLKRNRLFDSYLLDKIDMLRKKRNSYVHAKGNDYSHKLSKRIFEHINNSIRKSSGRDIPEILENDAKTALELMYTVFNYRY